MNVSRKTCLLSLIVVALAFFAIGCNRSGQEADTAKLVGLWRMQEAGHVDLRFKADGTYQEGDRAAIAASNPDPHRIVSGRWNLTDDHHIHRAYSWFDAASGETHSDESTEEYAFEGGTFVTTVSGGWVPSSSTHYSKE